MRHILFFTVMAVLAVCGNFCMMQASEVTAATRSDSIRAALEYHRDRYPAAQYRDVYKNFMQDFFGPGHMLNDTTAASRGLRRELAQTQSFDGPAYEPTGYKGNFYRVNIGLIADGTIPYDVFFEEFSRSVQEIEPPTAEEWRAIWAEIDDEIVGMGWQFENEASDRESLREQLEAGDFVVHHSDAYNASVNFHYRIISRERFEARILPQIGR